MGLVVVGPGAVAAGASGIGGSLGLGGLVVDDETGTVGTVVVGANVGGGTATLSGLITLSVNISDIAVPSEFVNIARNLCSSFAGVARTASVAAVAPGMLVKVLPLSAETCH